MVSSLADLDPMKEKESIKKYSKLNLSLVKRAKYREKESEVRFIEYASDKDVFKIQQVKESDLSELQTIQEHKFLLLM